MIAIINVDKNPRAAGPHRYEIRINQGVVPHFVHNREGDLSTLLLKASEACRGLPRYQPTPVPDWHSDGFF